MERDGVNRDRYEALLKLAGAAKAEAFYR